MRPQRGLLRHQPQREGRVPGPGPPRGRAGSRGLRRRGTCPHTLSTFTEMQLKLFSGRCTSPLNHSRALITVIKHKTPCRSQAYTFTNFTQNPKLNKKKIVLCSSEHLRFSWDSPELGTFCMSRIFAS